MALSAIRDGTALPTANKDNARDLPAGANAANYVVDSEVNNWLNVTSALLERARDVVNVRDYGAVGDGVTDDTAAVLATLNAATTGGKTAFFPRGTYKVTSRIAPTLTSPFRMVGDGAVIKGVFAAGSTDEYLFDFTGAGDWNLELSGITFDQSSMPTPSGNYARMGINFQGASAASRANGLRIRRCIFKDFLNEKVSNSVVDHAVRVKHASRVVIDDNDFDTIKGWSVFLEIVSDFMVSRNRSDGNHWGGIELRNTCVRGKVLHNIVTNCTGTLSGAVDMLGVTDAGTSSDIEIAGNYCEGQFQYNAGIRMKAVENADCHDNVVVLTGADATGNRYGIGANNKTETAGAVWENVRIYDNTIIARADTAGGVFVFNDDPTAVACSDLLIRNNLLVEDGGLFTKWGVRVGSTASDVRINRVRIVGNRGSATTGDNVSNVGHAGIGIIANRTTRSSGIYDLIIEDNEISSSYAASGSVCARVYGYVTGGRMARNAFQRYATGITIDVGYSDVIEGQNSVAGCVTQSDASGLSTQVAYFGANGKPASTTVSVKRVPKHSVFRVRNPAQRDIKGWYTLDGGQFSSASYTVSGSNGNTYVDVDASGSTGDLEVGDRVTIAGGTGERTVTRLSGSRIYINTALAGAVTSQALTHVAPTLRALGDPAAGTTANRPTTLGALDQGFVYYDETLGLPIFWTGSAWKKADGTAA